MVGDIRDETMHKIDMLPASMLNAACLVSQLHVKKPPEGNGKKHARVVLCKVPSKAGKRNSSWVQMLRSEQRSGILQHLLVLALCDSFFPSDIKCVN